MHVKNKDCHTPQYVYCMYVGTTNTNEFEDLFETKPPSFMNELANNAWQRPWRWWMVANFDFRYFHGNAHAAFDL